MPLISKRYFVVRTLQTVAMIFVALTALFVLFRIMPGDYSAIMLQQGAGEEAIQAFEQKWGLNEPIYMQFWIYATRLFTGDVGNSLATGVGVVEYVKKPLLNTIILVVPGITTAYLLGVLYGLVAGTNRGSFLEEKGLIPIIFVGSFPAFFLAIMLIVIFSGWLNWFPTSGMLRTETTLAMEGAAWYRKYFTVDFLWHYTLPFTAVVLRYLYLPSLIMRTSVVEVLGQDFHYYQRVTGLSKLKRLKTTAKHASLPIITLYPISLTQAIGGIVLIETVFNWPGVGFLLVNAVTARDTPVLMFVFFLIATTVIIANFIVDIIYGMIDPRVQVGE